jgi:hypothetical protein
VQLSDGELVVGPDQLRDGIDLRLTLARGQAQVQVTKTISF